LIGIEKEIWRCQMPLLSVIIPARNEEWLYFTVNDVITKSKLDTEAIVILDGYTADLPKSDKIKIIHHDVSVGQRAATNEGARLSTAKYVMKLDAHCALDDGFDEKMISEMQPDWTMVPRMYNLHVFSWQCRKCRTKWYMGPAPTKCENPKCDNTTDFKKKPVWRPRLNRRTDFMRFDNTLHFQYWRQYGKRPEAQGDVTDQMCCIGACWMMERDRYWAIDGLDENHGSWGQMGVEIACKTWLSGGRQVVNKKTWFGHMFRTQQGFGFPYPNPGTGARQYSRDMWLNNKWSKQIHRLEWLLEKFWPVDGWSEEDLVRVKNGSYAI